MDLKYYYLLPSITTPELPASKTYEKILQLLKDHLCKMISILIEKHNIFCRKHIYESLNCYVTALKELSKTVEFKSNCENIDCSKSVIDLLRREQFIHGLCVADVCEIFLQQSNISFEFLQILEIALAIEASKI